MVTENSEIEVVESEIESVPESGGLVKTSKESVEDTLYLADNIEKIITAQNKIRAAVMGLAQPGDWVLFGGEGSGKAEIGFAGAMRIGSTLGVNFTNWEARKEIGRDDLGEHYRWEYECDAIYRNRTVRVYGRASSRDKFLGKVRGEYRPLHEIDEGNIKMIARRSAMKEGVKVLFGLHHMDPAYISKFGIKLDSASGHSFKTQDQKAEEVQTMTVAIKEVRKKEGDKTKGQNWTLYTVFDTMGGAFRTFSESIATSAHNLKGKTVTINFHKTQYGNEIDSLFEEQKGGD